MPINRTPAPEEAVDAYIDRVWPLVQRDIERLVKVPSCADYSAATEEDPYGPAAHEGLRCALQIAGELGLEAHDCGGHIGYADLPGASEDYIATIAHVDVVPAGAGWQADPFTVREREGYLLGRGTLDDKGPLVLSLYAARFFAERGERLPYTLRALIGSDEEVGMRDVAWYLDHYPQPLFLFTPDANFPVGAGEKGHLTGSFVSSSLEGGNVVDFQGGAATNAIPGQAEVTVRADADRLAEAPGIEVEPAGEGLTRLVAHGKGGHASLPAGTINAIGLLVAYLRENALVAPVEQPFFDLLGRVFASTDGSTLGIGDGDEAFGAPTCIGGTIRKEGDRLVQTVDTRFTTALTIGEIERRLSRLAGQYGATFTSAGGAEPYLTDPSSDPVQALIGVYNQVTGKHEEPFTIGGGTYARKFAHAVSFGPEEDEPVPAFVGTIHGPEEGAGIDLLRRSLKIYIMAIDRLMGLSYGW